MSNINEVFIRRLKSFLGKRSAYWLSKESGVAQGSISRILSGKMNPTLEMVESISKGLGVSVVDLLNDDGTKQMKAVPADLYAMLSNCDPIVYEAIRAMMKPLQTLKKKK